MSAPLALPWTLEHGLVLNDSIFKGPPDACAAAVGARQSSAAKLQAGALGGVGAANKDTEEVEGEEGEEEVAGKCGVCGAEEYVCPHCDTILCGHCQMESCEARAIGAILCAR